MRKFFLMMSLICIMAINSFSASDTISKQDMLRTGETGSAQAQEAANSMPLLVIVVIVLVLAVLGYQVIKKKAKAKN